MTETATPQPSWLFSIVVVGAMDPRQHHPLWYQMSGAFTQDEVKDALQTHVAGADQFGQFSAAGFTIQVVKGRWQITTSSNRDRAVDIAALVFEKLYEVPVAAFGVNAHGFMPTGLDDAGAALARIVKGAGLDVGIKGKSDGYIRLRDEQSPDRHVTMILEPSDKGKGVLGVTYSVHHPIELPLEAPALFDLSPMFRQHCDADWRTGVEFAEQMAAQVRTLGERHAAR